MNCHITHRALLFLRFSLSLLLGMFPVMSAWAVFTPAQNLNPSSANISLDSSFQSDAWLVYTYDIGADGRVVNAAVRSTNGVPEVEQAVLQQIKAMQFKPAMRDGSPVKVSAGPVTYTWILDKPRAMSPRFKEMYQKAWAFYAEKDYGRASELAVQLKDYPGRNALEEVKSRLLAASLASRRDDGTAELQFLNRVVELQTLAQAHNFKNTYVPNEQYLKILNRIQTLQLDSMMLADAAGTLEAIEGLAIGSPIAMTAADSYRKAEQAVRTVDDVAVPGELVPLYREGPGSWKVGLFRERFSLSDVRGKLAAVFLVCANAEQQLRYPSQDPWVIPAGWSDCEIDVSGEAGTRLVLHQHAPG